MAMTVGGQGVKVDDEGNLTGGDGEEIVLEADKNYKVGVSAYKSTEITTGTDEDSGPVTNSAKYYGPEKQSTPAYLPEYEKVDFDISYRQYPLEPDENGMYTHSVREIMEDAQVKVDWHSQSSSKTYSCAVTRTDTGEKISTEQNGPVGAAFDVPENFVGSLPLRIEVNVTRTDNGATVTDTTVKYLTIILDDVAPVVTFDLPYFYADENGNFTVTGLTEPGTTIRYVLPMQDGDEIEVGDGGSFSISGTLADGEGLMLTVEAIDEALNSSNASVIITTEPDTPDIPDEPDEPDEPVVPPTNPNYRIDIPATEGGTVTADPTSAKAGTEVTLTPTPDAGFDVGTVTVTDRFGDAVEVTANPDGTYTFTMPNGQVSVAVTFVEAQPEPLPFTDVNETDWFRDAVQYVYDNGLMDGVGDNLFAPNSETTRAQLVTILHRLEGEPEVSGTSGFTDVEAGTWYTDAVAWAAANGIVNGVSETEFAPGKDITREQLATILFRYAEAKGYDVSARADLSAYPDADQIQSYATESVAWAVAEGLIQGFEDNTLRPAGNATRAQIATILMRFCEGVAK